MTIYCIYGWGKSKTTGAIGISMRALANGEHVLFTQFLKDGKDLGLNLLKRYNESVDNEIYGRFKYLPQGLKGLDLSDKSTDTAEFYNVVKAEAISGKYSLVILDEINVAQDYRMLGIADKELLAFIQDLNRRNIDVYMTGRLNRHDLRHLLTSAADIASDIHCEAHSFNKACRRCGMEFTPHYTYCPICGQELINGHKAREGREF